MRTLLTFTFLFFISPISRGQITFQDSSSRLVNPNLTSGVSMGVADMNGDGLDDIVRLDDAEDLEIEYQSPNRIWTRLDYGNLGSGIEWSMCVADADKNGFNDLLAGGFENELKFLVSNPIGADFTTTFLPQPLIFLQGSNFADINNDGEVDIFACHDLGLSSPYRNTGQANFIYDTTLIYAASINPSTNAGNYGSTWTDYDNDGDLDMYLSKCFGGITDPQDGRRRNQLFQNDGAGNYVDVVDSAGLLPLAQSWATDFADFDNDGNLDAIILNHDTCAYIYQNNGDGTFVLFNDSSGVGPELDSVGFGIQVKSQDFDNDGHIDILTTSTGTSRHWLFMNNGDGTFHPALNPFPTGGNSIQSAATGDLNNDGFIDVIAGYAIGLNGPSSIPDQVFFNSGNQNNYFKILLEGDSSNINAIGARVELFGSWGLQIREVRAGESYGVFHSFTMHFGIGTSNQIDSAVIKWPSGKVSTIINPGINTFLKYRECENDPPPVAGFSQTASDLDYTFIDNSIQSRSWIWDLGDGNYSNAQNPIHSYSLPGTYTVCQIARGCGQDTACVPIQVTCPAPVASFGFSQSGQLFTFSDSTSSLLPVSSWEWNFGDGSTSNLPSPTHVFTNPGVYDVCLKTTSPCGEDSSCQTVVVSALGSNSSDNSIAVFPNPTDGRIWIEKRTSNQIQEVQVIDIRGRIVRSFPISTSWKTKKLDLGLLESGIYFLMIRSSNGIIRKTLVIED